MMCTADELIKTIDPRRDTGGVGQMCSWGICAMLFNLTKTFYSYLISNPISICLAYVLVYCLFGYFVNNLDFQLQMMNMD